MFRRRDEEDYEFPAPQSAKFGQAAPNAPLNTPQWPEQKAVSPKAPSQTEQKPQEPQTVAKEQNVRPLSTPKPGLGASLQTTSPAMPTPVQQQAPAYQPVIQPAAPVQQSSFNANTQGNNVNTNPNNPANPYAPKINISSAAAQPAAPAAAAPQAPVAAAAPAGGPTLSSIAPSIAPKSSGFSASAPNLNVETERRLTVGYGISLEGKVSNCDKLVIYGNVNAELNNVKALQISDSGKFRGAAEVELAEISGSFEGDLRVRKTITINATGRVNGKITYGSIEIKPGGKFTGEIVEDLEITNSAFSAASQQANAENASHDSLFSDKAA